MSEAIAASLSLEEVLATIGDTAIHEIKGDLVSTWLDDGEGGYFERQRLVQPREQRLVLPPASVRRVTELPTSGERRARARSRDPTAAHRREYGISRRRRSSTTTRALDAARAGRDKATRFFDDAAASARSSRSSRCRCG